MNGRNERQNERQKYTNKQVQTWVSVTVKFERAPPYLDAGGLSERTYVHFMLLSPLFSVHLNK